MKFGRQRKPDEEKLEGATFTLTKKSKAKLLPDIMKKRGYRSASKLINVLIEEEHLRVCGTGV